MLRFLPIPENRFEPIDRESIARNLFALEEAEWESFGWGKIRNFYGDYNYKYVSIEMRGNEIS